MGYKMLSVCLQEYIFPDVKDRAFLIYLHKLAKQSNYDVDHYNGLMEKLSKTENDLENLKQPLGLTMSEVELQSLLHGKPKWMLGELVSYTGCITCWYYIYIFSQ